MVTKHLEQLCEKEFALKQDEAYKGFDRELANLREHYAHHGLLVSSSRAQAVMDAALLRFDKILDGFENIYLAKFSDPARLTDEEDVTWLKKIVGEKMETAIFELRTKVQSDLWEQSCALTGYWQRVESETRKRSQKIGEKIEIIQLQKKEWAMQRIQIKCARRRNKPPRHSGHCHSRRRSCFTPRVETDGSISSDSCLVLRIHHK